MVHQFAAVTILLSVLSAGALAFALPCGAAVQTGPSASTSATQKSQTIVPGKNPRSALCQEVHTDNLALRKRLSNVPRAKLGKWSGIPHLDLVYDEELSDTAQAILGAGKNVPANVRIAARKQVSNRGCSEARSQGKKRC